MKKVHCRIIDTYNDFLGYWMKARSKNLKEQIEEWQTIYMQNYPGLLAKQVKNYEEMHVDWREVAKKIFPQIPSRLELMRTARDNILTVRSSSSSLIRSFMSANACSASMCQYSVRCLMVRLFSALKDGAIQ